MSEKELLQSLYEKINIIENGTHSLQSNLKDLQFRMILIESDVKQVSEILRSQTATYTNKAAEDMSGITNDAESCGHKLELLMKRLNSLESEITDIKKRISMI